jgi:hypothetical protein
LVDLIEYLTTLRTPSLSLPRWHVLGPLPADGNALDHDFGPEKGVDLAARYAGKTGPVGWRTLVPDGRGYLDLSPFGDAGGSQSVSYLAAAFESPTGQLARILCGTNGPAKVWVNGELVHTYTGRRSATPGADTVRINLRQGRNSLLVKLTSEEESAGCYLTILSETELRPAEDRVK